MTAVNVQWAMSKKAALEQFALTGNRPDILKTKLVDLEPLSVEQRRVLLASAYNPGSDKLSAVYIHGQKSNTTTYPPDLSTKDYPVEFDAEPTIEQIVETISLLDTMETERKAAVERKSAADRAALQKSREDEERVKADLAQIVSTSDLQGAKSYMLPSSDSRLASYKDGAVNRIKGEMEDAKKAQWVTIHGSDHLKRACAAGYDCQRLYVVERAAVEAPGWIVDYNSTGRDNGRSCPSMEALIVENASVALAQQIGATAPTVRWLTDQPTNQPKSGRQEWSEDDEMFEECEVVLMRKYLGEYDLYKIV